MQNFGQIGVLDSANKFLHGGEYRPGFSVADIIPLLAWCSLFYHNRNLQRR